MNLKHSVRSVRETQTGHTWCESAGVTLKIRKHKLVSKSLQQNDAISYFCTPLSSVPSPGSSGSARPELCCLRVRQHSDSLQLNSDTDSEGAFDFKHRFQT